MNDQIDVQIGNLSLSWYAKNGNVSMRLTTLYCNKNISSRYVTFYFLFNISFEYDVTI